MTEFVLPSVILVDFNYPHSDFEQQNANMLAFMEALGASRQESDSDGTMSKVFHHADYTGHIAIHYSELEHPVYAGVFRLIIPNIGNVDIGILKSANTGGLGNAIS